jgi:LCP family protein required for cell wall assembly
VRRRHALVALALVAWTTGSVLGAASTPEPAAAAPPWFEIGLAHAGYVPALDGTSPVFILFIGSDARPGQPVEGERTDSIHIVGINPAKKEASILGFPRDSYVEIPGHGMNKINTAMFYGGPDLTVQTVESLTGIKIAYWVLTSFEGITAMVNEIGGLKIDVPFAMHDTYSHADFEPGQQRMNGKNVLAFTRDRHSLPAGDFGRSENQGIVFISALTQFRQEFRKDPSRVFDWVAAGMRNVDSSVPLDQVLTLAFTASMIDPDTVQNMVVPGTTASAGNMSIVQLSSEAQGIYADMKKDGLVSKRNVPPSPNALPAG